MACLIFVCTRKKKSNDIIIPFPHEFTLSLLYKLLACQHFIYWFLIFENLRILVSVYVKENKPVRNKAILGLPDLENKNTRYPVKFEFYINNK